MASTATDNSSFFALMQARSRTLIPPRPVSLPPPAPPSAQRPVGLAEGGVVVQLAERPTTPPPPAPQKNPRADPFPHVEPLRHGDQAAPSSRRVCRFGSGQVALVGLRWRRRVQ